MRCFLDVFRNSKISHVVGHILSQIDVTKTLRPIQAVIICIPMILNTVLQKNTTHQTTFQTRDQTTPQTKDQTTDYILSSGLPDASPIRLM